jgi:hypothetical protein
MSRRFLPSFSLVQALIIALLLAACASTRMTSLRAPDFATRAFVAPAVLVVSSESQHRRTFEDAFVAELKQRNIGCRSSWRLSPVDRSYPSPEFKDALRRAGVDALIVISGGPGVNGTYAPVPDTTATAGGTTRYSQARFQGTDGRPSTNLTTTVIDLGTARVAWVASSESSTNSMSDADAEEISYRKTAAERMVHERLFRVAGARSVPVPVASMATAEAKATPPVDEGSRWTALSRASLKLSPGQTRDEVTSILGPPTLTEYKAADPNGAGTNMLTWRYEVGRPFVLLFEKKDDWRLASWSWP